MWFIFARNSSIFGPEMFIFLLLGGWLLPVPHPILSAYAIYNLVLCLHWASDGCSK